MPELLPFQKEGVAFALDREASLIADGVGLGKTAQAVGVINGGCLHSPGVGRLSRQREDPVATGARPVPLVGRRADIMRRTDRLDWASGLRFSQYPNDLFLAESTSLHLLLFLSSRTSVMSRSPFSGSGHVDSHNEDASRLTRGLPCECAGSPGSIGRYDSNPISRVRLASTHGLGRSWRVE
jgi:hypothetical protein